MLDSNHPTTTELDSFAVLPQRDFKGRRGILYSLADTVGCDSEGCKAC